MEYTWKLENIFKSLDDYYNVMDIVHKKLKELQKYQDINGTTLFNLLEEFNEIKKLTNDIWVYGSLKYYQDINNPECIKLKTTSEEFYNDINNKLLFVNELIINVGEEKINEYINENNNLLVYKKYLDNIFRLSKHLSTDERIVSNTNEINKLLTEYNTIINGVDYGFITIDNEEVSLKPANINKYLLAKNRDTRNNTFKQLKEAFKPHLEHLADILRKIINKRQENALLANYNNTLEQVLNEENLNQELIDILIANVNNNLNLYQEYFMLKGQYMGIDDLHTTDLNGPLIDDINPHYSVEEAINIIKEALKPLGEDYIKLIDVLLDGHIDLMPNEKKHQSITFSWNTYSFLNYRGTYNDLKNLIHELGHIINYYLSKDNVLFIYEDSTIFVGETASIVNEILLNHYLIEHTDDPKEKLYYINKEIENYVGSIFKQTLATEYELKIKSLTDINQQNLDEVYQDLINKYYGNKLIIDDVSGDWSRLSRLYRWNYYSYTYATGLLIASTVVNKLTTNTISSNDYLKFLASGSSLYSKELLNIVGIDIYNQKVFNDGFAILKKDIDILKQI